MPNGEFLVATHTALIPFPKLPLADHNCDVFPALQQPLLSLGQSCDEGFTDTLNSETVLLTKEGSTILPGTRDYKNGLYFIPSKDTPPPPPPPYLQHSNHKGQH